MTDPRLTPSETAALQRLLATRSKGGEGWHPDSSASEQVRDILAAGETRDDRDERLLEMALRLADPAMTIPIIEFPGIGEIPDPAFRMRGRG